ncbi:MAG: ATP-binding protein [Anaerolineaceae bacterium]
MTPTFGKDDNSPWESFEQELQAEYDRSAQSLKEIGMMLDQSQGELTKLTQRNTSITVRLQQLQAQIDTMPATDVRFAYDAALDAQQRLFVMRGQMEKLQSDRNNIQKYADLIQRTLNIVRENKTTAAGKANAQIATLEMMINAQEAERQRLSRQMHDGPAQALSNFILQADIAMRLFDVDPQRARDELNNLKTSAMSTFQNIRNFIFDLRPMMLDDLGVVPTIRRFVDNFKEQTGLDVSLVVTGVERRLESYIEVLIFRSLQEIMSNVVRHSQASQVKIQVQVDDASVRVSVEDNGKGFDVGQLQNTPGVGLKLIRERVELMGGTFDIDSVIGQGAHVIFKVPCMKA